MFQTIWVKFTQNHYTGVNKDTNEGAKTVRFYSLDTDVLVLAIRRFPNLAANTCMVTGTGQKRREISIRVMHDALGPSKAAALPGFHTLTGVDITRKFGGKGKITYWKVFEQLDNDDAIVRALTQLGVAETISESTISALEAFVCKLYIAGTKLTNETDARWWLFKRKQAQAESMPPTKAAQLPTLSGAHYQAMIWYNDIVANPEIPSPQIYGWNLVD